MRWSVLVLVAACRFGFEPLGDDAPAGSSDGGATNGDAVLTDGSMTTVDALPAACAEATTVTAGITPLDTCTGSTDRIDGCAGTSTNEIVIHFRPTVTQGYAIAAYDQGTMNVGNSTGRLNPDCASIQNCAGVIGTTLMAGTDYYFVVEASSGGCANIDFSIQ